MKIFLKIVENLINLFEIIFATALMFFMVALYGSIPLLFIKSLFFDGIEDRIYFPTSIAVVAMAYLIIRTLKKADVFSPRCPHGIRGGEKNGKCSECTRIRIIEDKKKERERLIAERVNRTRAAEIKRLKSQKVSSLDFLYSLSPQQFETAVMDMFRHMGYKVTQTSYANDRGKDGIAWKNGKKYVIECKRYEKNKRIGRPPMQKFFAAMHEENAVKGYFVTTADYASTAREYAKTVNIDLIDGNELVNLMTKAFPLANSRKTCEVICQQCGESVYFDLDQGVSEKTCSQQHLVKCNIRVSDIKF